MIAMKLVPVIALYLFALATGGIAITDTIGCGIDWSDHAGKPSTNFSITSSGGNRSFLVHVPSKYNENTPTALILSYHGNSRTATYQEELSQFSNETFNPHMITVYPQGVGNSWEGPSYAQPGVSDLKFTDDLLNYMRNHFCIDNSRIYANGKSNGGGFVGTLACSSQGGNFAAFAPISGAFYTDSNSTSPCFPARVPLPILEFHGTNDTTIPYDGGRGAGGQLPSIPNWLAKWAVRNGCSNPPKNTTIDEHDGIVHHTKYSCNGYKDIVQGYKIDGLAHIWPSTQPNLDNKGNVTVLDATKIIISFFSKWHKP